MKFYLNQKKAGREGNVIKWLLLLIGAALVNLRLGNKARARLLPEMRWGKEGRVDSEHSASTGETRTLLGVSPSSMLMIWALRVIKALLPYSCGAQKGTVRVSQRS